MKKWILPAIIIIAINCITNVNAQTQYQRSYIILKDSTENNAKLLKGVISKEDIMNDTAFRWYGESQKIYQHPDSAIVAAFRNHKDSISFIVFGGTWCEDSQFIIPKFFRLQELSGFPEEDITLFAVDRHKNTFGNIADAMHIVKTPTIIVMQNGKEKGRVEEYGKSGYWDKELAAIINN